jgi:outer membrane protein assembly factor BamB
MFINGIEPFAIRKWGAFDSVALIDGKSDTLIECGENGILYKVRLNTNFNKELGSISISPDIVMYRYHSPMYGKVGAENSPAIYKNYAYFADNSGILQCVNINTLEPVWIRYVNDDTDSTPVIEKESDSQVYLYTACEVDLQKNNGYSYLRKLNALNGELLWEKKVKASYDWYNNGGALATPVIGKNDINNLVIFNVARTSENNDGGKLIALDKKTGEEVWVLDMKNYTWSSPVDVYTKDGKSYLIQADSGCNMHLIEGKTGKIINSIFLGGIIEASPVVYGNMVVIGTRGQEIYGIRIK